MFGYISEEEYNAVTKWHQSIFDASLQSCIVEELLNQNVELSINDYSELIALLHAAEFKSSLLRDKRDKLLVKLKKKVDYD